MLIYLSFQIKDKINDKIWKLVAMKNKRESPTEIILMKVANWVFFAYLYNWNFKKNSVKIGT